MFESIGRAIATTLAAMGRGTQAGDYGDMSGQCRKRRQKKSIEVKLSW